MSRAVVPKSGTFLWASEDHLNHRPNDEETTFIPDRARDKARVKRTAEGSTLKIFFEAFHGQIFAELRAIISVHHLEAKKVFFSYTMRR
jgi:hypothetical protein